VQKHAIGLRNLGILRQFGSATFFKFTCASLYKVTERKRLDGGDNTVGSSSSKEVSLLGKLGGPLQVGLDAGLGSLSLSSLVGNLTSKDLLLALGLSYMLNPDMNTLLNDTSIDGLVDTDSNSGLGYVENDSGTSVVVLVGHTLVDRRVSEDIDVVTNLHLHLVLGKGGKSVLTELLGKHVPGTGAGSE
jgi:hypothetical protein